LPKLCEHRHDPVQQGLGLLVFLCGQRTAHLQNVLHSAALQRRAAGHLEAPSPVSIRSVSVAFRAVQAARPQGEQLCVSMDRQSVIPETAPY